MRFRPVLFAMLLLVATATAWTGEPVAGSGTSAPQVLRVAVVDLGVKAAWRAELTQTWCESLRTVLRQEGGDKILVRLDAMEAGQALDRLERKACDAVVILGEDRPRGFRRLALPTFAASFGPERNFESAYLILNAIEPALRPWLTSGFTAAVARPRATVRPVRRLDEDRAATSERLASRLLD